METPLSDTLRDLIRMSGLPLKHIAAQSGVKYQPLQRWIKGVTEKYDVASADRVHRFLALKMKEAS